MLLFELAAWVFIRICEAVLVGMCCVGCAFLIWLVWPLFNSEPLNYWYGLRILWPIATITYWVISLIRLATYRSPTFPSRTDDQTTDQD